MNSFIKAMNLGTTANGALTYKTTYNCCLDLFSVIGCQENFSELFWKAYKENQQLALRILFWSRDCRGGAGARKTFQEVIKVLQGSPEFSKIFKFIPEFGYWKDLFNLQPTKEIADFIIKTLKKDKDHSLCAKYCPRKGQWFSYLRKIMNMSAPEFRHFIVQKTQVVENYMCANKWSEINYSTVPSIAGVRYSKSFKYHDQDRYTQYLVDVKNNKTKINASVLFPHQVYQLINSNPNALIAYWNALPNYMEECTERILPICDVSGSMLGLPLDISISLGCYISERNEGEFKNCVMTFSDRPEFITLSGNINDKFRTLRKAPWGGTTNLQAVFDLILNRARQNNIPEKEMPTKLLIISDMEFNYAAPYKTNFELIKEKYTKAGYKMPTIIFWNVNGREDNSPVSKDEENVALISGYSPSILTHLLKGEIISPIQVMLDTVNSERYQLIKL